MLNNLGATYQQTLFVVMGGFHRFRRSSDEAQGAQREHMNEEAIEKPLPEGGKQPQSLTEDYGIPLHPLDRWDICHLLQTGRITLPPSTELEDKRKSDGLAKVFVLLQTVWSIIQFIARREPAPSGSGIKRSIFKGFLVTTSRSTSGDFVLLFVLMSWYSSVLETSFEQKVCCKLDVFAARQVRLSRLVP